MVAEGVVVEQVGGVEGLGLVSGGWLVFGVFLLSYFISFYPIYFILFYHLLPSVLFILFYLILY